MDTGEATISSLITADTLNFYLYGRKDTRGEHCRHDTSVFTPPQLTLQPSTVPGSTVGVYSTTWIHAGTLFGPVAGRTVAPSCGLSSDDEAHSWEVLNAEGHVSHHVVVDVTSWTAHVVCARHDLEQNLVVSQRTNQLFYEATKLIRPGEELLVWYGSNHSLFLGMLDPDPDPDIAVTRTTESSPSSSVDPALILSKFRCVVCQRPFNSRSNLRSHMRIHTLERPFTCSYCQRAFSQSSTLRNHMRLHTGEKPYRCSTCCSSYSQLAGLRAHQKSARHRLPVTSSSSNDSET